MSEIRSTRTGAPAQRTPAKQMMKRLDATTSSLFFVVNMLVFMWRYQ